MSLARTQPLHSPQLALKYDNRGSRKLFVMHAGRDAQARRDAELHDMFLSAVQFQKSEATIPQAITTYQAILAMQPEHAAALINLGTIQYKLRQYQQSEQCYREATIVDPGYALAFFNLGNVLEELQRQSEAIVAFVRALALAPRYADAHFNLALAYERQGQPRRALRHWLAYVRLDPSDPSAAHAKERVHKILSMETLRIVSRRGQVTLYDGAKEGERRT